MKKGSFVGTVWQVAKLGLVVVATFALCWAPFLSLEQAVSFLGGNSFPFKKKRDAALFFLAFVVYAADT